MPECDKCEGEVAFTPTGSICINCGKIFTQVQTTKLTGFDNDMACLAVDLMIALTIGGVPVEDIMEVHVLAEGLIVKFRQDAL